MFLAIQIIVVATIARIRNRIFGIKAVPSVESSHQGLKTVHIRSKTHGVVYRNISITNTKLKIICGKQLIISHIIPFNSRKRRIVVGFRVAVPIFATDRYVLGIAFQASDKAAKLVIIALIRCFMMSSSAYNLFRFKIG